MTDLERKFREQSRGLPWGSTLDLLGKLLEVQPMPLANYPIFYINPYSIEWIFYFDEPFMIFANILCL